MKHRLRDVVCTMLLLVVVTNVFADDARLNESAAVGTAENPIVITAGEPVQGPGAASYDYQSSQYVYPTHYVYTATQDGVVTFDMSRLGYVMGIVRVGDNVYSHNSAVGMRQGEVMNINIGTQTNSSSKTFTLNIRDYAQGETVETAKPLKEGANAIAAIINGGLPNYYSVIVPAGKVVNIKFNGYPSAQLIVGDDVINVEYSQGSYSAFYVNAGETSLTALLKVTALYQSCTAIVSFSEASDVKAPVTRMGNIEYSAYAETGYQPLVDKVNLNFVPSSLRLAFPHTDALGSDRISANVYVFELDADGNQTGAPINLSHYEYSGNVEDGIIIDGLQFELGKSYKIMLSQANFRELGDNGHGGVLYEYSFPNANENPTNINSELTFSVKKVESQTVNVKVDGWTTFVAPFDVNVPEGVCAYVVDGVDDDGSTLMLLELSDVIPANTPVVLQGSCDETVSGIACESEAVAGLLTGVYEATPAPVGSYVLKWNDGVVDFCKVEAGSQPIIAANQCYLTKK